MTLAEVIYEKVRRLPEDKAPEVIDFIDFIQRRPTESHPVDERLLALTPEQREAYEYLNKIRIDWGGKPITDREEANAPR